MPVVINEQDVKQKSLFLKYDTGDMGNALIIKSHLYQIDSHFLQSVSRSVACRKDECLYCGAGYPINTEYNYVVDLNGQSGVMNIKGSVFFAIKNIAKAQKKDVRQISWTVIKKGEGLKTEYTTSKDDNLHVDDYQKIMDSVDDNTAKLTDLMKRREDELEESYTQHIGSIKGQKATPRVAATEEVEVDDSVEEAEVDPKQIPF